MSVTKSNEGAESQRESALLDQLLEGCEKPEDLLAPGGAFNRLRKRLIERVLGTELSAHLGYPKGQKPSESTAGNHRNGYSAKTVLGEDGPVELAVPRDRLGTFEPQLIKKGQSRFEGFDQRIIAAVCAGHDGAGDSGFPAGTIRGGSLAGLHQLGYRGRARRSDPVAEPALGKPVSHRGVRRVAGEDPGGRAACRTRPCIWRWAFGLMA